jgi:hypothetical protein
MTEAATKQAYYAELLSDPFTPTAIVGYILADHYGGNWFLNFDFATVLLDLKKIQPKINPVIKEKIKAFLTLLSTDMFYIDWVSFENISWVFNGKKAQFSVPTPLQIHELVWSVIEADILDPYEDNRLEDGIVYSKEVKQYISKTLLYQGFYETPEDLKPFDLKILETVHINKTDKVKTVQSFRLKQVSEYVKLRKDNIEKLAEKIKQLSNQD